MQVKKTIVTALRILRAPQLLMLYGSWLFFSIFSKRKQDILWVVGTHEIAKNIHMIGQVLTPSITVCLTQNPFYNLRYDHTVPCKNKYMHFLLSLLWGPVLLGYLSCKATHFWFIWSTGFLINREDELRFLKKRGKKIVWMFCGDDICAPRLILDRYKKRNEDCYIEYVNCINPNYLSKTYDLEKRQLAKIADAYADVIFSAKNDQKSYLASRQYPFFYCYDKCLFDKNDTKFLSQQINVMHAPSSFFVKGTCLVRAAIKKLQVEGYQFNYIELCKKTNEEVLATLKKSHIVLNQFYGGLPALFGVEAMANHCAVLQGADPTREEYFHDAGDVPWIITRTWEIYDNLKFLLDNPDEIQKCADACYAFAEKHYTLEPVRGYIGSVLKENHIV